MAHGLISSIDNLAFRGARSAIWHRIGVAIPDGLRPTEATVAAGADWPTELLPVYADGDGGRNGGRIPIPTSKLHVALIGQGVDRKTIPLGLVSSDYQKLDNLQLAAWCDELAVELGSGGAQALCDTMGVILGGRRVWWALRIPGEFRVGRDDWQLPYLVVATGHGGHASVSALCTAIRPVCQNTLRLGEQRSQGRTTFAHVGDVGQAVIGLSAKAVEQFRERATMLANLDLSPHAFKRFLGEAFVVFFGPEPSKFTTEAETLRDRWHAKRVSMLAEWATRFEQPEQTLAGIQGTAWAAYNAVSGWVDHGRKGGADQRTESKLFGEGADQKAKVLQLATVTS